MNWLFRFLDGILDAYSPEDQDFLRAYWTALFQTFLTYHQQIIEKDLDYTLIDALPVNKSWYVGLEVGYVEEIYTISALPYQLPTGMKSYKVYGTPQYVTEVVTLPVDLGEDVSNITVFGSTSHRIDGTKILGTGIVTVQYSTSVLTPVVSGGFLTGPSTALTLTCLRTELDPMVYESEGEVLVDGTLYDPNSDFSSLSGGTIFTLGTADFYFVSATDSHTATFTALVPGPGRKLKYSHNGFQYVIATTAYSVPEFDNGWISGRDFYVNNAQIGFATLPPDVLIAPRVYYYNDEISDMYGKIVNYIRPENIDPEEYLKNLQAYWYGLWNGSKPETVAFVLHALLGLPHTRFTGGEYRLDSIEASYSNLKDSTFMTVGKFGYVTTDDDYFSFMDKHILFSDGGVAKIVKYLSATEVVIAGYIPEIGAIDGSACVVTACKIYINDKYGVQISYTLPPLSAPMFAPGATIPVWSRLCTGVNIIDARHRKLRVADPYFRAAWCVPDVDAYNNTGAPVGRSDRALRSQMLRGNTFLIEFDYTGIPDTSFVDRIRLGSTQFQTVERGCGMMMRDTVVII